MQRILPISTVVWFGALVALICVTSNAHAQPCSPKHPVRGTWSLSQTASFVDPELLGLPPGDPVSTAAIGNLSMDECGNYSGTVVLNGPDVTGSFPYSGSCTMPTDGLSTCSLTSAFGDAVRECVASDRRGPCFRKWSCVVGDASLEPGLVLLAEFTRQGPGACQ